MPGLLALVASSSAWFSHQALSVLHEEAGEQVWRTLIHLRLLMSPSTGGPTEDHGTGVCQSDVPGLPHRTPRTPHLPCMQG